jgi:glutamate-5-semialdehyde dehydrogenase
MMNKNKILADLAYLIDKNAAEIIRQNQLDLSSANGLDITLKDRLKVDDAKVKGMIKSIEDVIGIEDPENKVLSEYMHPNGMQVVNKVVPFGKILIIYESRPDVTVEAAISAFKAGNKIYLKGGKEARNSNLFLVKLWHEALAMNNVPTEFVTYLDIARDETQRLIKDNPYRIDLIIPRGGDSLINYIRANTSIPLLISGRGNNFIYVHNDADFNMMMDIVLDGKSRLSVCNAVDKVLFNKKTEGVNEKIDALVTALKERNIEVMGTQNISRFNKNIVEIAGDDIFYEEFLDAKIFFDKTNSLEEAIATINKYSGGHTAVIITEDKAAAEKFQNEVDCAAVMHNTSSRFTDGGQFGLGAEIAISTQKLHFRGPLGLTQLVTNKWFVSGTGQIR